MARVLFGESLDQWADDHGWGDPSDLSRTDEDYAANALELTSSTDDVDERDEDEGERGGEC